MLKALNRKTKRRRREIAPPRSEKFITFGELASSVRLSAHEIAALSSDFVEYKWQSLDCLEIIIIKRHFARSETAI